MDGNPALPVDDLLRRLEEIVGPAGMVLDENDQEPYLIDQRRAYHGDCAAIVRPASTEEVSKIVALCAETGTALVPQGGNTGLCGGATPETGSNAVLISLTRMNRIRDIDPLNYTITAEAGVILAELQQAADEADRLFPLSLGAEGTARIGGNLSTNAGGTGVLRYGTARDLTLGLEVVLPDGRIWEGLTRLRKDNTGYDLKHLFMGAEGTLGIITAAVLKLFPKPRDVQTAFVAVKDCESAIELLSKARTASDDRVTAFEWIARRGLSFVLDHIPDTRDPLDHVYDEYLLIELTSGHNDGGLRETLENILGEALESGAVLDAALAESEGQARDFWRLRETIPEAQMTEGASIKHDISVAVSLVPEFLEKAGKSVTDLVPGIRICAFGHVGDGNVHYNVTQPVDSDGDAFLAQYEEINRAVHDVAVALGGSISAEHGIGKLKRHELDHYKSPIALDVMRQIKNAIDPQGIMNPGKVI